MIDTIWQDGPLDTLVTLLVIFFAARKSFLLGRLEAVIGIVLMVQTLHCTMACGKRWIKEKHKASVLRSTTTYAQWGLAIRCAVIGGQGGGSEHDAQPGGGVGQTRNPVQCHRTGAGTHGGSILR